MTFSFVPSDEVTRIRARLDHPVIDADGHWVEYGPVFTEQLKKAGGEDAVRGWNAVGGPLRPVFPAVVGALPVGTCLFVLWLLTRGAIPTGAMKTTTRGKPTLPSCCRGPYSRFFRAT